MLYKKYLKCIDEIIKKGQKPDVIFTDLLKFKYEIQFNELWNKLNTLIKKDGTIILLYSKDYQNYIKENNINNFKYDFINVEDEIITVCYNNKTEQESLPLLEGLIKTYTKEGDIILNFSLEIEFPLFEIYDRKVNNVELNEEKIKAFKKDINKIKKLLKEK